MIMRTTFTFDNNNHAQSDILSKQLPHTITVGTPVTTTSPYETELGTLPVGAKGFVKYIDETTGEVGILMEGLEPALIHWGNVLVLEPFHTEDLLAVLSFERKRGAGERRLWTYTGIAAGHLVALLQF
jgi:hypothetical protein